MPRSVRYEECGGIDVLRVVDVDRPVPGPGQVLVKVKAAGISPQGRPAPFVALHVPLRGRVAAQYRGRVRGGPWIRPGAATTAREAISGCLQNDGLRVVRGASFPLEASEAHRAIEGRRTTGKVLLTVD